ncbi:MAG: DUF3800 domain-containing protein [Dehalococcoidia bacterium]|nr:DUF3800 domain-containing protein [Dehalococcoidia bacterium]
MARIYVYADESGNFDFSLQRGASRYFVLTTVTCPEEREARRDLEELRYDLAWAGDDLPDFFHATEDLQDVRDRVFGALSKSHFRVDATIMEKRKAHPRVSASDVVFYKYAWLYHMRHVLPSISTAGDEILVVVSSIGTRKKRQFFRKAVADVIEQIQLRQSIKTTHWSTASDLGLQIADYCSWAIFRKWEEGDERSYRLIQDRIHREYDLFRLGTRFYY